jgi:hypothetical protein
MLFSLSVPSAASQLANESYPSNHVILYLERHRHATASIDSLAYEFGLKRRTLYEFITICCTFGICHRVSTNSVQWLGIDQSASVIGTLRQQARECGADDQLNEILASSIGSSVSEIALAIVKLFFLLRVQSLDIRKISCIFAQKKTKYKTMLRKVYTVAAGLEFAAIVKKTTVASEIRLRVPLDWNLERPQMNLRAILNTNEEIQEEQKWVRRRQAFEEACVERPRPNPGRVLFPPILPLIAQFTSP